MTRSVLVLSGLDPTGAAGLTRDLWALSRVGMRGIAIPTCLTIQDSKTAQASCIDLAWLEDALETCVDDESIGAVKTGLVVHDAVWQVALPRLRKLAKRDVPIVVDPVRGPSAGGFSTEAAARESLVGPIAQLGAILTPNLPELQWLASTDEDEAIASMLAAGYRAVFVKGGHREDAILADRFATLDEDIQWRRERIGGPARRGTGCTLASFLAAELADGLDVKSAARAAGHRLGQAWRDLDVSGF